MTAINFDTTIYVKPVRKSSAQGRERASLENRDSKQTFVRGFHKASGIEMPISFIKDSATGKRITGLDVLIDNPYEGISEADLATLVPSQWRTEVKEKWANEPTIPVQVYLEIKWNLVKDTLDYKSGTPTMVSIRNNPNAIKEAKPNFIDTFEEYLSYESETSIVNPSRSIEEALKYLAIIHSPRVAPEYSLVNEDKHEFYISLQRTSDVVPTNRTNHYKNAVMNLAALENEQTSLSRYMIAIVLGVVSDIDSADKTVLDVLNNFVLSDKTVPYGPHKERLIKFNKLYEQFTTEYMKFYITYLVKSARNTGIILQEGMDLIWVTRDSTDNRRRLGSSISTVYKSFYNQSTKYDESVDDGNPYGELLRDLTNKGVKLES